MLTTAEEAKIRIHELNQLCLDAMKIDDKAVRQAIAKLVLERVTELLKWEE